LAKNEQKNITQRRRETETQRNTTFASSRLCAFALIILFIGIGFRFHALTRDARFHPDEALFATFARSAALNGAWLLPGALDKPPLSIYSTALSMLPFAQDDITPGLPDIAPQMGEFAARWPNVLASILIVAMMYPLAKALYRDRIVALFAMLLMALSPYAIAFSATSFTDGFMLLFMVAALWAMAAGKWTLSGVCLALSFASKQQAVFYLPLLLMIGWTQPNFRWIRLVRFVIPMLVGTGLLIIWDAARAQETGFWALGLVNNDPLRLLRADELIPRLNAWLTHGGLLLGYPIVTALLVMLAIFVVFRRIRHEARHFAALIDVLLLTYILAYGLPHWLIAFNTFDRYLLPILPPLILLTARGMKEILLQRHKDAEVQRKILLSTAIQSALPKIGHGIPKNRAHEPHPDSRLPKTHYRKITFASLRLCVFALMLLSAWAARNGKFDIGGDNDQHDGIDGLAAYLDNRTLGAIIYDHWLGWELGYYLGQWTDKRRVFYPTPNELAADAAAQADPAPRYFIAPEAQPIAPWLDALIAAGFRIEPEADVAPGYVVYRLLPPE
jgi:hypothetical protein